MSTRTLLALCLAAPLALACRRSDVVAQATLPRKEPPPPTEAELALSPPVPLEIALPPPPSALPPFVGSPQPGPDGYAPQTVDRVALLSLLFYRRFEELNRTIEDLQSAFERDYRKEYWPADAFDTFDSTDPRLTPLLDEWVQAFPASYVPWMARGTHRVVDAWFYRGDKYVSETRPEQFAAFERRLEPAIADLKKAFDLHPRLVVALRKLLQVSRAGFLRPEPLLTEALRLCPDCFLPRVSFLATLFPEWGGSPEQMEAFVRESSTASRNRRLALLPGFIPWYQSGVARRSGQLSAALALINHALSYGEYAEFLYRRAIVRASLHDDEGALRDLDRAGELRPVIGYVAEYRASLAAQSGYFERAARDLIFAIRLEPVTVPPSRVPPIFRGLVLESRRAAARADAAGADRLLQLARTLEPAMNQSGEGAAGTDMLASVSGTPLSGVPGPPPDPSSEFKEQIRTEKRLFGEGRWREIAEMWTEYLTRYPEDANAYFRRGQALETIGQWVKAQNDFRRACELGSKEGCVNQHHQHLTDIAR